MSFTLGALIPLVPFLLWHAAGWNVDYWALVTGVVASLVALAVAGLFTSLVTSRNPLYTAGDQSSSEFSPPASHSPSAAPCPSTSSNPLPLSPPAGGDVTE